MHDEINIEAMIFFVQQQIAVTESKLTGGDCNHRKGLSSCDDM